MAMITFIQKHKYMLCLILITSLACLVKLYLFNFQSRDFVKFLNPWLNFFRNNGGLVAIAKYKGDYNAPYILILSLLSYLPIKNIYLIKGVSLIFDFLLAIAGAYLSYFLTNKKGVSVITYATLLFLPQFLVNGSMWGQCDSIYTFFGLLSLIYLLKEKYFLSFAFLGVSFAFKLQAVFIIPLYIILYFTQRKFSIRYFFLIPLVEIILCIPNMIFGMPIWNCVVVYFKQIHQYTKYLTINYPNIYQIINFNYDVLNKVGASFVVLLCFLILCYLFKKHIKWNNEKIINLGFLLLMLVTYFLPCMHDRYAYFAEVLSIIYYLVYRKNLGIVIMVNLSAIVAYASYLSNFAIRTLTSLYPIVALIYGIFLIAFTKKTLKYLTTSDTYKKC